MTNRTNDRNIIIEFSEIIATEPGGNENAFIVHGMERQHTHAELEPRTFDIQEVRRVQDGHSFLMDNEVSFQSGSFTDTEIDEGAIILKEKEPEEGEEEDA
jgi:hypothetical protein